MEKRNTLGKGIGAILFWSIISAAFIGPGTVTTAAKTGASFGLDLLWALTFSIIATIVLQEAAARLTIASGKNLGEIISLKVQGNRSEGIKVLIFLSIAFGCAAYQAGNLIGARTGLAMVAPQDARLLLIGIGLTCAVILFVGRIDVIAKLLGLVVAGMGIIFMVVASKSETTIYTVVESALLPTVPDNSMLYIIGLVGTTIVPYNLFLASGVSSGQSIGQMRIGLITAILIGGMISMAIMVVGTMVTEPFSFEALGAVLSTASNTSDHLFSYGLFAAGISSSITAPLAAAVAARSLFGNTNQNWTANSIRFRAVWLVVLLIGFVFALLEIKPIPAIIMAQAINGALLPIVAIALIVVVNDRSLLPDGRTNGILSNVLMLIVVAVACFLGIYNLLGVFNSTFAVALESINMIWWSLVLTFILISGIFWWIFIAAAR